MGYSAQSSTNHSTAHPNVYSWHSTSVPSRKYKAQFSRSVLRTEYAMRFPTTGATGSVLLISSVGRSAHLCHAFEGLDTRVRPRFSLMGTLEYGKVISVDILSRDNPQSLLSHRPSN